MIVSAAWLAEHLGDASVVVADVRWYLRGKRGRDAYDTGHIPGAHFVDLDGDLSADAGPGRHPLPSAGRFAALLSRLGATADSHMVAYDDMGGAIAARLWFLCRYFEGAPRCSVLDGGIDQYARSASLSQEEPPAANAPMLSLRPRSELVIGADAVAELAAAADHRVIDSRSGPRYRGETEPVDPRAGHIPGAHHGAWADNLADGVFKDIDALRERFATLGATSAKSVAFYCGSGVTACHNLLALSLAGRDDALLYEGSWSDWSSDPDRAAASGPDP